MYLNIILTILCLILLSILFSAIYFWKKYVKKFLDKNNLPFNGQFPQSNKNNTNIPNINDSIKFMSEMLKNLPKR
jgi:hypothetical protein